MTRWMRFIMLAFAVVVGATAGLAQERTTASGERTAGPAPGTQAVPGGNAEHGRYLAEQVVMCVECHSPRDDKGNILHGQEYLGGAVPYQPLWPKDFAIRSPRIRGLPGYSDPLALRLLTEGSIGRDGKQLRFPMLRFRMTPQDAMDVVAYMRSLR